MATHLSSHGSTLLLALLVACAGDGDGGDEVADSGETGVGACVDPGMTVPGIDPFVPPAEDGLPVCAEGWASDAPLEEARWVIAFEGAGDAANGQIVRALPGKRAIVVQDSELRWYDENGQRTATLFLNATPLPDAVAVREDGHVFLAVVRPVSEITIHEFVDGGVVGDIHVATPGWTINAVALHELSPEGWVLVGTDDFMDGEEMFFMRVDAQGNKVLRGASDRCNCYNPASVGMVDAEGNLLFGRPEQLLLANVESGTVLDELALPGLVAGAGSASGAGFAWVSHIYPSSTDALVTGIDGAAVEQWTHTYERILDGNDHFYAIASGVDGDYVIGGAEAIWWETTQLVTHRQPLVIAVDEQGGAQWKGRLAIPGETHSVDVASDGTVAAAGVAWIGGINWQWVAVW